MNFKIMNDTAFIQEGDGPVVVLVHGLGLNKEMWQWQLDVLKKDYRVIRYDLLGHGNSDKPSGSITMTQMVDQLYRLMKSLGHDRYALVGFSLGGLIVQAFALAHPEPVLALGILNTAHARTEVQRAGLMKRVDQCRESGPAATIDDALARWFSASYAEQNPATLAQVRQWVLANDPLVYPELYELLALADIGLEERISTIECPTLVLTGDEDYGNSPEMAQRMASLIPRARLEVLKGLRHMALAEDPQRVNGILTDFLSGALRAVAT